MDTIQIEYPEDFPDYALLDSGDGEKMETFNNYVIVRPDPRALWQKSDPSKWQKADARFVRTSGDSGHWNIRKPAPNPWHFRFRDIVLSMRPTDFKHVGVFPEQTVNWDWIEKIILKCHSGLDPESHLPTKDSCFRRNNNKPLNILNLFAYTGGATMTAAGAGAFVTHVDSVKSTITWAHENAQLNQIPQNKIRWIEDDAYKFVQREIKRGKTYDALIMDPPRFGRGSQGEVWKLEEDLPKLFSACKQILKPNPLFVLVNAYTADLSSIVIFNLLKDMVGQNGGTITAGELASKEKETGRLLPQGIFGRYERS